MTDTPSRFRTLLALLVLFALGGCVPLDNLIGEIFGRSMRDQPSISPYEAPRAPPEGAVPFAAGNFPSSPGEVNLGQAARYGDDVPRPFTTAEVIQQASVVMELENPVAPDGASLERGEVMYQRYCAPCHGVEGGGEGPVTEVGYPAFPLIEGEVVGLPDGYYYGIIRVGRGLMPQYGHQITHYDRWHIVNYVRELQGGVGVEAAPAGDANQEAGSEGATGGDGSEG